MKYLLFILSLFLLSCSNDLKENSSSTDGYDRGLILKNYTENIIIPAFNKLESDIINLENSIVEFSEDKTASNFEGIKNNFIETYKSWQYVEMFDIELAEEIFYANKINIYPVKIELIETNISDGNYDIANNNNLTARGLPAIDYLLYGKKLTEEDTKLFYVNEEENSNDYIRYLLDVINHVKTNTAAVSEDWKMNKDSFIASSENTTSSSLNKLTNDYIYFVEKKLRSNKIGIPAGKFSEGEKLNEKVEAFYSKKLSKDLTLSAINATIDVFEGKHFNSKKKGESFYSYLIYLSKNTDNNNLASEILSRMESAKSYINSNLSDNFSEQIENDNSKMLNAFDELQKVVVLLKIDLLQQFNISVDYTDADGD